MRLSIVVVATLFGTVSALGPWKSTKDLSLSKVATNKKESTITKKHDAETMFAADVAVPAKLKASMKNDPALLESLGGVVHKKSPAEAKKDVLRSRRLQDEVLCEPVNDGSGDRFCVDEDSPQPGFQAVFVCPNTTQFLYECQETCAIFQAESLENITATSPQCASCGVCGQGDATSFSYNCTEFAPDEPCSARDCSGNCLNGPSAECFAQTDGTVDCALLDAPTDGLIILFTGCPTNLTSVLECTACEIPEAGSYPEITDASPRCNSCSICVAEVTVSYDCSNFSPDVLCATTDCMGNCTNSQAPTPDTPAPVTPDESTPAPATTPPSPPGTPAPVMPTAPTAVFPTDPPAPTSGATSQLGLVTVLLGGAIALLFG